MKESVGYTVTLNIIITFIIIVFTFLSAILIYYKSNKVNNIVINSIEKYEGANDLAIQEIDSKMSSLGYNKKAVNCQKYYNRINEGERTICEPSLTDGTKGYCVFYCSKNDNYYYYKVSTNMMINIPIINDILDIPIFSNTNRLFDFESEFSDD